MTRFVDTTETWRLAAVDVGAGVDVPAGGVAVADMDNDGDLDLVVANGRAAILPWENGSYGEPTDLGIDGAVAVTATDVDGDGWIDVLVARRGPEDVIIWGGDTGRTSLPGGSRSSGLIAGDLGGDARLDILRLGFEQLDDTGAARIRPPGAVQSVVSSSWASGASDFNLDGRLDLAVANGGFPGRDVVNKIPDTQIAADEAPSLFIGDGSGRFVDMWPSFGIDIAFVARGMSVADLDGDGDDDIVMMGSLGVSEHFATTQSDHRSPSDSDRAATAPERWSTCDEVTSRSER